MNSRRMELRDWRLEAAAEQVDLDVQVAKIVKKVVTQFFIFRSNSDRLLCPSVCLSVCL